MNIRAVVIAGLGQGELAGAPGPARLPAAGIDDHRRRHQRPVPHVAAVTA